MRRVSSQFARLAVGKLIFPRVAQRFSSAASATLGSKPTLDVAAASVGLPPSAASVLRPAEAIWLYLDRVQRTSLAPLIASVGSEPLTQIKQEVETKKPGPIKN